MTKERLEEMIDSVLSWGADHNEEFRECLVNALGITEEEYKELFDADLDEYLGEEEEEEKPTMTLTVEYRHKETGLNFVRFNGEDNDEPIYLYCSDDKTGKTDTRVTLETLNKEYEEIVRYMEED